MSPPSWMFKLWPTKMTHKRQSHNNFLTELIFATCDHRLVDFFAGPAINHWDKWPVVGVDVEFSRNQSSGWNDPTKKITSLCTFAEKSLWLDVCTSPQISPTARIQAFTTAYFPRTQMWPFPAMEPIFFPKRASSKKIRWKGRNGKISSTVRCFFGWIQNWPPLHLKTPRSESMSQACIASI